MEEGTNRSRKTRRTLIVTLFSFVTLVILAALLYAGAFGPMWKSDTNEQFLVTPNEPLSQVADELYEKGYIRASWVFTLAYLRESTGRPIRPGGYEINRSMDAFTIASQLVEPPYVAWVTIPVGVRKEQIADILSEALGWTEEEKKEWNDVDTATNANYVEGVYFPDTYLIPTDQPPAVIAERMRDRFKEEFALYADEALKKNISWQKVLTIASLIEREAGSVSDMSVISGVIQKRLAVGMPLAIDATLQYMTGTENNWWPTPKSASTYPDSPFNTYKRKGLPPHPIANPGLAAIEAALNPAQGNCLFYLHDPKGQIHCSPTYAGQQANVQKYLK